ncbi:MAG TPA: SDR family oxidoreductase [Nocardioidaceae bacterium]|nr:SDR family oxidoreductase [Nocardioidaceae bacterium]
MKTFLVTGASTGIGEACALHLDSLGHRVYAGVRKDSDGDRLRAAASDRLRPVSLDVTDEGQVAAAAALVEREVGSLDGVVNNAGIAVGGALEHLPIEDWRHQLEVNVIGQVSVTKAVLPLIRRATGRIVFMGSMSGRIGTVMLGPYCASKFAIEAIGETLRTDLHPWGIKVAIVEPGGVKTPIWEKAEADMATALRDWDPAVLEQYADHAAAMQKAIALQAKNGVPPEKVAKAVEHALLARRPKLRYPVGADARGGAVMVRLLPDRPREAILRKALGL